MITPGPWKWIKDHDHVLLVRADFDGELHDPGDALVLNADTSGGEYGGAIDTESDDAKLIAAAPLLLAAVERIAQTDPVGEATLGHGSYGFECVFCKSIAYQRDQVEHRGECVWRYARDTLAVAVHQQPVRVPAVDGIPLGTKVRVQNSGGVVPDGIYILGDAESPSDQG